MKQRRGRFRWPKRPLRYISAERWMVCDRCLDEGEVCPYELGQDCAWRHIQDYGEGKLNGEKVSKPPGEPTQQDEDDFVKEFGSPTDSDYREFARGFEERISEWAEWLDRDQPLDPY